jgi:hypothetical protein
VKNVIYVSRSGQKGTHFVLCRVFRICCTIKQKKNYQKGENWGMKVVRMEDGGHDKVLGFELGETYYF